MLEVKLLTEDMLGTKISVDQPHRVDAVEQERDAMHDVEDLGEREISGAHQVREGGPPQPAQDLVNRAVLTGRHIQRLDAARDGGLDAGQRLVRPLRRPGREVQGGTERARHAVSQPGRHEEDLASLSRRLSEYPVARTTPDDVASGVD